MKILALLAIAFLSGVSGKKISPVNIYADDIFGEHLPVKVKNLRLDPGVLPPISFKISGTSFTNRDVKANFTKGTLKGLASKVKRLGYCDPVTYKNGLVVAKCNIDFSGLKIVYEGTAKGDTIAGTKKNIIGKSKLVNTTGNIVVHARPGGVNAILASLTVNTIHMKTKPFKNLDLNKKRSSAFERNYQNAVEEQVIKFLTGPYKDAVSSAVSKVPLKLHSY